MQKLCPEFLGYFSKGGKVILCQSEDNQGLQKGVKGSPGFAPIFIYL